jgi:lipopolysaccharide transport system ATP-binding protein
MSTVISVENVSKAYRLGQIGGGTLREDVSRWWAKLRGRPDPNLKIGEEHHARHMGQQFWALDNVSFKVKQGEVVGIIGRNGAGKSTLLKILSQVTTPTSGQIKIKGRIASLLEVGTGFNPEMTGRENIFLNGAILGMTKAEIRSKFDEIVAFSELQEFLDTPVKRYSNGMYVRLAFAVAAHLEPEILIVDEVLAVGDATFQEKCLGKMQSVSSEGRTILFVSHNIGAVQSLCGRGILVEAGRIAMDGNVEDAVSQYFRTGLPQANVGNLDACIRMGNGKARITGIRFEDDHSNAQTYFRMGEPMNIIVRAIFPSEILNPTLGVNLVTDTGIMVADCRSSHYDFNVGSIKGEVIYRMRIKSVSLYPRTYVVEPWVADDRCLTDFDWVRNAATIVVIAGTNFIGGNNVNSQHGISHILTEWSATTGPGEFSPSTGIYAPSSGQENDALYPRRT